MSKVFLVDIDRCNGCYNCQIVCKDEHCEQDWQPYAASQPLTGHFWMKIDERVRGQVPWVRISYIPTFCAHCTDAPCEKAGNGAVARREDGLVIIDPRKAGGMRELVESCPLGAIYYNEELDLPQKCTGCAHLLDNGWKVPRCVDACATDALLYGEEEEFGDLLRGAQALEPVAGLGPRVFYRNLPQRFIAGTAVDFAADEVVKGVIAELKCGSDLIASQETDEFGDFKFDQIPANSYQLCLTKDGYLPLAISVDVTEIDRSVGDLALERAE